MPRAATPACPQGLPPASGSAGSTSRCSSALYEAGRQSALDPKYVVASQRETLEVLTER
jgi:hypothetical protein